MAPEQTLGRRIRIVNRVVGKSEVGKMRVVVREVNVSSRSNCLQIHPAGAFDANAWYPCRHQHRGEEY